MPQRLWRVFLPDPTSQGLQTDMVALALEQGSPNVSVSRDHLLLRHSTVSAYLSLCYPSFFALQTLLVTITHVPLSSLTIPLNLQDHPRNLRCPVFHIPTSYPSPTHFRVFLTLYSSIHTPVSSTSLIRALHSFHLLSSLMCISVVQ